MSGSGTGSLREEIAKVFAGKVGWDRTEFRSACLLRADEVLAVLRERLEHQREAMASAAVRTLSDGKPMGYDAFWVAGELKDTGWIDAAFTQYLGEAE